MSQSIDNYVIGTPGRAAICEEPTQLNASFNAIDRHVASGAGHRRAIVFQHHANGRTEVLTYAQLQERTSAFAGALRRMGVSFGDKVVMYMPMIPETVVAMLACARIGAVYTCVSVGAAPRELTARLDSLEPKVVLSASCVVLPSRPVALTSSLDRALAASTHRPDFCVIKQRSVLPAVMNSSRDLDWSSVIDSGLGGHAACVDIDAVDALYTHFPHTAPGDPWAKQSESVSHMDVLVRSMKGASETVDGRPTSAGPGPHWVTHSAGVFEELFAQRTLTLHESGGVFNSRGRR